jgi:NAD:arginine ADP-ribosyltransferase
VSFIWESLMGKAEPTMDLKRAKALLRAKQQVEAKGSTATADLLTMVALAEDIRKIPNGMREEAATQLAQEAAAAQQTATPQDAPEDLGIKHLRGAFRDYELAKTQQEVLERLNVFHLLAVDWVNSHRSSQNPLDVARVSALTELTEWAAEEMVLVAKEEAEQIYMDDVTASANSKFPLQAITNKSLTSVQGDIAGQGKQGGLTEAQRTAFRIFTGPDYGYINPATVVNRSWLESNKTGQYTKAGFVSPRGTADEAELDKDRMSEGALHAGMLDRAMKQLPPYEGTVYRGLAADQVEFQGWSDSKEVVFKTMTSTSKKDQTARQFAADNTTAKKPIELVYIIENSGGRDIREFSQFKGEDEIMVAAGTRFTVTEIKPLDGKSKAGGERYEMKLTG